MIDREMLDKLLPASIRNTVRSGQYQKIATLMTGVKDFSIDHIAQYLGTKVAMRHAKWRPVANGLLALDGLLKNE